MEKDREKTGFFFLFKGKNQTTEKSQRGNYQCESRIQSNRRKKRDARGGGGTDSLKLNKTTEVFSFFFTEIFDLFYASSCLHGRERGRESSPAFPLLLLVSTCVLKCVNVNQHSAAADTVS